MSGLLFLPTAQELKQEAQASRVEAHKKRQVMARLRQEEMTRRRAQEALARTKREKIASEARLRRLKSVKRTGGGFVVRFDHTKK